jgi:hypothetical protein
MRYFSHSYVDERPPNEVREDALLNFVPSMGRAGYPLEAQDERSLTFVSRYYSGWVFLVCILFFPIGLLALLSGKRIATLLMTIEGNGQGTRIIYVGETFRRLRKQIELLPEERQVHGALYYVGIVLAALAAVTLLGLIWGPLEGVAIWALVGFGVYKLVKVARK